MKQKGSSEQKRCESKEEVLTFLDKLNYALNSSSVEVTIVKDRLSDKGRAEKNTNRYTLLTLFPDEDLVHVLKSELSTLTLKNYIETVSDTCFLDRSDIRVFGKKFDDEDVYIKIRVELLMSSNAGVKDLVFVLSYHFAEKKFNDYDFPYGERGLK